MAAARVHPTAVLIGDVQLGDDAEIGPFAVLDGTISLGERCVVSAHSQITGQVVAGWGNHFHSGSVIGGAPQHLGYAGETTQLIIGDQNHFREHVTVHRGMPNARGVTRIGDGNFFMAGSHVAHDCIIHNRTIFANNAVIGGHAEVMDGAFLSGNTCVHQFCRVGRCAMISGTTSISMDLPPYWIAQDINRVRGVNVVGMRRAGIANSEILAVRAAFKIITRSGQPIRLSLEQIEQEFGELPTIQETISFVRTSQRGICIGTSRANQDE